MFGCEEGWWRGVEQTVEAKVYGNAARMEGQYP